MSLATLQCLRSVTRPSFAPSSSRLPLLRLRNEDIRAWSRNGKNASKLTHIVSRPRAIERFRLPLCVAGDVSLPEPVPEENAAHAEENRDQSFVGKWRRNAAELRAKAAKWGLAAVLAYGLFDGITYTTFFVLAFLGYEKSTGQNPAANLKALLGVVVLMWGGNNVTRPFRVAGAAALAPAIDRGLKKLQEVWKLPNQAFAFMICVAVFASLCFSVVGILILSRLGG
ncbi:hypothetical protein MPTK1_1g23340 [Marchantia polymorpha subsp. ruderalis]|uniref:Uncharacterized protein n=2 Tax=Marchantia polymorpha TaxID=3197 RepID=A0AAF6ATF5_MARPO|nr:hypothetical protein MARPO_0065s0044 [Marchantia polymorpha]BBM99725.1 hypothetical protein Mp_1g23340 [Marchantia polymorpha subsp. ruderalis]|eukprot:PTQ36231.1 hypothetical protein MARPO_0065s0044 [Marchantia polymorpha]